MDNLRPLGSGSPTPSDVSSVGSDSSRSRPANPVPDGSVLPPDQRGNPGTSDVFSEASSLAQRPSTSHVAGSDSSIKRTERTFEDSFGNVTAKYLSETGPSHSTVTLQLRPADLVRLDGARQALEALDQKAADIDDTIDVAVADIDQFYDAAADAMPANLPRTAEAIHEFAASVFERLDAARPEAIARYTEFRNNAYVDTTGATAGDFAALTPQRAQEYEDLQQDRALAAFPVVLDELAQVTPEERVFLDHYIGFTDALADHMDARTDNEALILQAHGIEEQIQSNISSITKGEFSYSPKGIVPISQGRGDMSESFSWSHDRGTQPDVKIVLSELPSVQR